MSRNPEQSLWRAVLAHGFIDATSTKKHPEEVLARQSAISFLTDGKNDFKTVCEYAGIDPAYGYKKIKEAMENGVVLRLPDGEGWRAKTKNQQQGNHDHEGHRGRNYRQELLDS